MPVDVEARVIANTRLSPYYDVIAMNAQYFISRLVQVWSSARKLSTGGRTSLKVAP
jgi:hypothetical protein